MNMKYFPNTKRALLNCTAKTLTLLLAAIFVLLMIASYAAAQENLGETKGSGESKLRGVIPTVSGRIRVCKESLFSK